MCDGGCIYIKVGDSFGGLNVCFMLFRQVYLVALGI